MNTPNICGPCGHTNPATAASCENCGYTGAHPADRSNTKPTAWGLGTLTGTVTSPALPSERRPLAAIVVAVVAVAALLWCVTHAQPTLTVPVFVQQWAATAANAALTMLAPFIYLLLVALIIMVGIKLIVGALLGPIRLPGGRLLGWILTTALELTLRLTLHLVGAVVRLLRWTTAHLLAPHPQRTFTLTDPDGHPRRVRITRRNLTVQPGSPVTVTGATIAGTLHAYRVQTPDNPPAHPQLTSATLTATALTATAATAITALLT